MKIISHNKAAPADVPKARAAERQRYRAEQSSAYLAGIFGVSVKTIYECFRY
jgi:hypothetical protein